MKQNSNPKTKNILVGVLVVVFVVVFAVWMFGNPGPDHIEDTNGADNYALQTITEQDVVAMEMGSRGTVSTSETQLNIAGMTVSDGIKYSSEKFTGVYLLHTTTILKGSDIYINLAEFHITEGNFAFYVVLDGEIVGQVTPSEVGVSEFTLESVEKTGTLEYIIAGESASFTFTAPTEFN